LTAAILSAFLRSTPFCYTEWLKSLLFTCKDLAWKVIPYSVMPLNIADNIRPVMMPEIDLASHQGKTLLIVEEWGTGYRRVIRACEEGGYPLPDWQELGWALRVIFQPHPEVAAEGDGQSDVPVNVPANERQRWFLAQLSRGKPLKAQDIASHFDVTEKTARRDIADLKARDLIEFVGAPKTGFYQLVKRN